MSHSVVPSFRKPTTCPERMVLDHAFNKTALKGQFGMKPVRLALSNALLRLYVLGQFQVCDAANRPIALRNRKAQALLALLALSPRGERSRVWLRDKLWSGSDEKRSSTNLRQTLFEIRRDLGGLATRALDIGTQTISLRPGRVWLDHQAICAGDETLADHGLSAATELLEGFDIGDPEFEDWLMVERGLWADRAEDLAQTPRRPIEPRSLTAPADTGRGVAQTSLALMRSVLHGSDPMGVHLADRVIEGIANSLRELQPINILDLRDQNGSVEDLAASATTEFYCRLRLLRIGENVTLTLFLHRVSRMSLEWSQSIQCRLDDLIAYDGQVLQGFIAQSVDRLARTLLENAHEATAESAMMRSGYSALNLIFRLEDTALDRALDLLKPTDDPRFHLHSALRAYVASFRIGDNIGVLTDEARKCLRQDTADQMDANPFNSVALACFGHVLGYVFQEHEAAGRLLERAIQLNPAQPFAWDHFALHKIYTGDYETARKAAERAVSLGAYSPISYSYETTLTMAATLSGDYDRAVLAGYSALQKQPRFNPNLRYLMVAHSARGERTLAEGLRDRILQTDPDFRYADVQSLRFGDRVMRNATPVITHVRKLLNE